MPASMSRYRARAPYLQRIPLQTPQLRQAMAAELRRRRQRRERRQLLVRGAGAPWKGVLLPEGA